MDMKVEKITSRSSKVSNLAHIVFSCASVFLLVGCSSVLPTETNQAKYPWETFEEVVKAYDNIEIGKTKLEDLKINGFDPESTANMMILSYLDVVNRFSPILEKEDLPEGVQACIKAKENCVAYIATPANIKRKRIGNVAMDLFGFKQETKVTGWRFEAVFVMVDGVVSYKLWNGTPEIEEYNKKTTPLGPAQSLSNVFAP